MAHALIKEPQPVFILIMAHALIKEPQPVFILIMAHALIKEPSTRIHFNNGTCSNKEALHSYSF